MFKDRSNGICGPILKATIISIVVYVLLLCICLYICSQVLFLDVTIDAGKEAAIFSNLMEFIAIIIGAVLTAIIANIIVAGVIPKLKSIETLQKCGISDAYELGNYYRTTIEEILKDAGWINICFITGKNFFSEYKDLIIEALNNGMTLKLLIIDPDSSIAKHIDNATKESGLDLKSNTKTNIEETKNILKEIYDAITNKERLKVKLNDIYFGFPYLIAYSNKTKKYELHYHQFFLPRPSYYSMRLKAQADENIWNSYCVSDNQNDETVKLFTDKRNVVVDARASFAYCWKKAVVEINLATHIVGTGSSANKKATKVLKIIGMIRKIVKSAKLNDQIL